MGDKRGGDEREMPFMHLEVKNVREKKKENERKRKERKSKGKGRKKREEKGEGDRQPREGEGELQLRKKREEAGHLPPSTTVSRQSRRRHRRRQFCNGKLPRLRFLRRFRFRPQRKKFLKFSLCIFMVLFLRYKNRIIKAKGGLFSERRILASIISHTVP